MSQRDQLISLFNENGNRLTLGQIMKTTLAAEYRARITELRHEGFTVKCVKGKKASDNLYVLTEPRPLAFDPVIKGQEVFVWE